MARCKYVAQMNEILFMARHVCFVSSRNWCEHPTSQRNALDKHYRITRCCLVCLALSHYLPSDLSHSDANRHDASPTTNSVGNQKRARNNWLSVCECISCANNLSPGGAVVASIRSRVRALTNPIIRSHVIYIGKVVLMCNMWRWARPFRHTSRTANLFRKPENVLDYMRSGHLFGMRDAPPPPQPIAPDRTGRAWFTT